MSINIKKTKVMVVTKKEVTPNAKITIEGRAIEQVKKFIYLGHLITDNGKCDSEIKRRIEIARELLTTPKSHNINKNKYINQIEPNKMLCMVNTFLWCRNLDNIKNTCWKNKRL